MLQAQPQDRTTPAAAPSAAALLQPRNIFSRVYSFMHNNTMSRLLSRLHTACVLSSLYGDGEPLREP